MNFDWFDSVIQSSRAFLSNLCQKRTEIEIHEQLKVVQFNYQSFDRSKS